MATGQEPSTWAVRAGQAPAYSTDHADELTASGLSAAVDAVSVARAAARFLLLARRQGVAAHGERRSRPSGPLLAGLVDDRSVIDVDLAAGSTSVGRLLWRWFAMGSPKDQKFFWQLQPRRRSSLVWGEAA